VSWSRPAGAASAGAATAGRGAQSIARTGDTRTASLWCVNAHGASGARGAQTIGCRLCRCVAVACLSWAVGRSRRRWVTPLASRSGWKLQLVSRSAYNTRLCLARRLTVAATCACRVIAWDARGARRLRVLGLGGHGELRTGATAMVTPHSTMALPRCDLERLTT
jgi:hypothetical protein